MTMYVPNIAVTRLMVTSKGRVAFDQAFHGGLNIVRGENSSGKSTIMDFLFYGLGGDLADWREAALRCDVIFLEVKLNGKHATLAREISEQGSRPMRIYLGAMDQALQSAAEGWEVYPYRRGEKDSFSQVLFRFVGLPEVQYGESDTKITMNQVLRLLYADQLSPVDKLFRFQRFDDAITRQTVGELLCGAFSSRFYDAQLRLAEAGKEFADADSRSKSIIRTHALGGHPLTADWLEAERLSYTEELERTNREISELEAKIFHTQFEDRLSLNDQQSTYAELVKLQERIAELQAQIDNLTLERSDSEQFIQTVDSKLQQLQQADTIVEEFQEIEFELCPGCLAPIDKHGVEGACSLCKAPFSKEEVRSRSLKLINEFARQKDQSLELQRLRDEELDELRSELASTRALWEQAERHYRVAVRSPTTELRVKLRDLSRRAGYLARQLEDLAGKAGIIEQLAALTKKKAELQLEMDSLEAIILSERARNVAQLASSRAQIEKITIEFLKRDLARQSTFANATSVTIEFDGDRMAVNGDSYFSASSMVYLKNSVLASFALAAANDQSFNHPRLLIMDTVEDKGMEVERSQNFQRILAEYSDRAISDHQIIIATSMIAAELNVDRYTVGQYYTHDNRTLNVL